MLCVSLSVLFELFFFRVFPAKFFPFKGFLCWVFSLGGFGVEIPPKSYQFMPTALCWFTLGAVFSVEIVFGKSSVPGAVHNRLEHILSVMY